MNDANEPGRGATAPCEERPADPVAALEARLGLAIGDRATALAALTHKSYVNEHRDEAGLADNERLEFLGDAVIDLAVSHRLMDRFPGAREGDLSKMRAAVVDEQGLSEMARALDLGSLLRLGRGEEMTGGRKKASLLADAMEAVVAALYVGAGLEPVLVLIDRFLGDAFARAAAGTLDRDFKTQLQELSQSRLRATPRYRVVREHGPDHSKTFEVETDLRGEVVGRGAGRSKKDAEQAAAKLALELLGRRFAEAGGAEGAALPSTSVEPAAAPSGAGTPQAEAVAATASPAAGEPALPPEPGSPASPPEVTRAAGAPPAGGEPASEPAPTKRARPKRAKPRAKRSPAKAPAKKKARKGTRRVT
ncbi:ribonuclease III [Anaeromyxobacter terrae]|uniref:ribonuclease III n=1 Tax=Anaeromyxobacter terrae TaxID=2925406 RepID=UPI001F58045A|nr:ribonuclease III [Anaeromyxobacter sp. SG22]